jgi:hypothetical protein
MVAAALLCSSLLAAHPRLAVMDVRAGIGISPDLARGLGEALTHEVRYRNLDVDVLGAGEIRAMLAVQTEKSKLGCSDIGCLAEIGGALGADRIITASLNKFGDTYLFTVQLVDSRRARVMRDGEEKFVGADQGQLLAIVERAVLKLFPREIVGYEPNPISPSRISLIYDPEIPLTTGANLSLTEPAHSIGFELSVPSGRSVRYHVQLAYVAFDGVSGIRLDPLTFGYVIPLITQREFRLEIEPTISFLDAILFFTQNGSGDEALFLSSGIGAQVNLSFGPLYVFVSPVGLEIRYFGLVPEQNDDLSWSENAVSGAELTYRIRVGVGLQF